jgi:hypothetical protein
MPYLGLQSVRHGNSGACIEDIFRLHFPNSPVVADLTWGKGRFWRWPDDGLAVDAWRPTVIGLDADTRGGAMIQSDYRYVPLKDQSVDVAIFDPPFIFTKGLFRIMGTRRFFLGPEPTAGVLAASDLLRPKNASDLRQQTTVAMYEMRRIARRGMVLKGMDLVTGQHPNWWSYQVMHDAYVMLGIWPEDVLIQIGGNPHLIDPRWKNQYHFRRAHVMYLIYKFEEGGNR